MAIGDIITAVRYNNIQTRVANIYGTGSGTDGYGQVVASSTVASSSLVTALDMQELYSDISDCFLHQNGTAISSIADLTTGDIIADDNNSTNPDGTIKGYVDYDVATTGIVTNKFVMDPSQATLATIVTSSRSSAWNGTITHEFTVTFADADARRYFFNTHGEIRFSAGIAGGSGAKTANWSSMLSEAGVISFNYTETNATGSGTGSSRGNYDLTGSYQQIYTKAGSSVYAENDYTIRAREDSSSVIRFLVELNDDDAGDQQGGVEPGPAVDENVNGTVTSIIQTFRASGTGVTVPDPSFTTTSNL